MKRYLLQRSLLLLPTLFGALTLVFFLIHLVPGDPVEVMLGETASAADKEELRRSLALDQPLMVQYRSFLTGLLQGDLGRSLYEQSSVTDLIRTRLPATIELTLCAMAIAVVISFPLAILAAINKGIGDRPGRPVILPTGTFATQFLAWPSADDHLLHSTGLDTGLRSRWARSFSSPIAHARHGDGGDTDPYPPRKLAPSHQ